MGAQAPPVHRVGQQIMATRQAGAEQGPTEVTQAVTMTAHLMPWGRPGQRLDSLNGDQNNHPTLAETLGFRIPFSMS